MPVQSNTGSISSVLIKAVQDLSLARNFDEVTSIVKLSAREIANSDGATFVIKDENRCHYIDEDAIEPLWKGMKFPMETCISGWCMIHKEQFWIEDIYVDGRIPHDAYRPTFVKCLAMTPIRQESPIGAIGSYWSNVYRPSDEEMNGLQALANATSTALENLGHLSKLKERNKTLENINHQLSRLTWLAFHDLSEPLREVYLNTKLLNASLNEKLTHDQEHFFKRIYNSVEREQTLLENLQKFSNSNDHHINIRTVSLQFIVEKVLKEFKSLIEETQADINFEKLPELTADPALLMSVVRNLFSNSLKFLREEVKPLISINAQPDGSYWIISVEDNGCGISELYQNKIFDFFTRLNVKADSSGSGIGLALSKINIESMDGTIWYEPAAVNGSIFKFKLPRAL